MDDPAGPSAHGSGPPADRDRVTEPAAEGILVFGADGRLKAVTAGDKPLLHPPIREVADLERRFRQPDGMSLDLRVRGRHLAVPVDGAGPRVHLVAEPLIPVDPAADATLAVAVVPFTDEDDPQTLQRALGSVLAHELRTPLTTVYGGAELLATARLPESTRMEAARTVTLAAERLRTVVEDLVLLVRSADDQGADVEPVLLQQVVRAAAPRRPDADVPIDLQIPPDLPPVAAVAATLEHLVRNLVQHAVANSPAGGRVVVEARADERWVELSVLDDGPPLSDDERARAFDLFAPTVRQRADPSGANLGLVVARRLAQRLGGEIEAAASDHGARTVVRLPAVEEAAGPDDRL